MLAKESQQESEALERLDNVSMRDIGVSFDAVPDDEDGALETPLQSSAYGRVPKSGVARPKKKRALHDSIDMADVVYNLGEIWTNKQKIHSRFRSAMPYPDPRPHT
ncbi:hypothetical protein AMTRI_Chr07g79140 [Amborella trichopoda]|uniref:Uncharacterized protein n=1 Tax=Amborella trichopoda TaxID=13333 RepID=W1PS04_AMBTC|nr:hypothetical protein AMTR_s00161p00061620 [Amborella trichopoda]